MTSPRSSMRVTGRLRCFDPVSSLWQCLAVLVSSVVLLFVLPGSTLPTVAAVVAAVLGATLIASRDRRRPMCTSLLLRGCEVLDVVWRDTSLQATVSARAGRVSQVRHGWRLWRSARVRPGTRNIPVVVLTRGAQVRWHDGPVEVPLEEDDEILGALSVVTRGDNIQVEAIYGAFPSRRARPLAVRVASSEGAVQSWDPVLLRNVPWLTRRRVVTPDAQRSPSV